VKVLKAFPFCFVSSDVAKVIYFASDVTTLFCFGSNVNQSEQ